MQNEPLTEKTAAALIRYISENNLQSGDRIPTEAELAALLNVGRGTVREVVKILVSRNILTIKRGVGTYVAENFGISPDSFSLSLIQDKHKLAMDLLKFRLLIEPEIAAMAAQNATPEDITELESLCDEVERLMLTKKEHILADQRFHTKIAICSDNLVVASLFPLIHSSIKLFVEVTKSVLVDETVRTHRDIWQAISEHDLLRARDAMTMHLMYNKQWLENISSRQGL